MAATDDAEPSDDVDSISMGADVVAAETAAEGEEDTAASVLEEDASVEALACDDEVDDSSDGDAAATVAWVDSLGASCECCGAGGKVGTAFGGGVVASPPNIS